MVGDQCARDAIDVDNFVAAVRLAHQHFVLRDTLEDPRLIDSAALLEDDDVPIIACHDLYRLRNLLDGGDDVLAVIAAAEPTPGEGE